MRNKCENNAKIMRNKCENNTKIKDFSNFPKNGLYGSFNDYILIHKSLWVIKLI